MKQLLFISISLSVLTGGLMFNHYPIDPAAGLRTYWFKKTKKGLLRDSACINPLRNAIDNSLHFISSGFSGRSLPF
ncbi:MAG: hypothetical protein ABIN91_24875 [Mucilaginibacter sp.]